MKMKFSKTKMNVTVIAEKVDEKNGVVCLVSMFPSRVMVLTLSLQFLQLCADLSKKSESVKAIYIYESERSRCALYKMVLFIMVQLIVIEMLECEVKEVC